MEKIKIKPCPFCGGEGIPTEHFIESGVEYSVCYSVECAACLTEGPMSGSGEYWGTQDKAVEAWNTRICTVDTDTLSAIPKGFIPLTVEGGGKQYFNVDLIVRVLPFRGDKEKAFLMCNNDEGFVVEESVNEVLFLINNARR